MNTVAGAALAISPRSLALPEIKARRIAWGHRVADLKRMLFGTGLTAYDDPGAVQTVKRTRFVTENDPATVRPVMKAGEGR